MGSDLTDDEAEVDAMEMLLHKIADARSYALEIEMNEAADQLFACGTQLRVKISQFKNRRGM